MQIKQLLEKKKSTDKKKEIKNKALDLVLKYSFVTPVSSLVVVKPNATQVTDTEAATSDDVDCPKTSLNAVGHCSLFHSCPQVHALFTSSDVFVQQVCILKN
ncbi:hypothetical protein ILUMI_14505, partial [Ignelater luminosus]